MLISKENILSLIPQRPPFVMVDELKTSDHISTVSTLLITVENVLVANGELCEAGLVENIAQTAAARAGYMAKQLGKPVALGFIGAVKNLEIFSLPKVNDSIETEIIIANQIFDVTVITGTVRCKGEILARGEIKIFIQEKQV
jgi:predicted hotdog family 3-hydroxylacyl-ACP dehydratase